MINKILKQEIELISVPSEVFSKIGKVSEKFVSELKGKLKKRKVRADVFIGGSLAKGTLVKKDKYDIDIFVRFEDYKDAEVSKILGSVLGPRVRKVHGSRDYYQEVIEGILLEIIPVLKIRRPEQAENIMDLSYFHVNYVLKKMRENKRLGDEIRLAKSFAHAQNCYGAESYIHGFSGYGLELLICYYGSFLKFVRAVVGYSGKKIVIDPAKFYGRGKVLNELNESKTISPMILIDPTFKERNVLAGLNDETFNKFREVCKKFLRRPSVKFFDKVDVAEQFKKYSNVRIVKVKTSKQAGDISGSKSKKFFEFFVYLLKREFEIKKQGFDYDDKKNIALFYFVLNPRDVEIVRGPPVTSVHHLSRFKKAHKGAFIKNHISYARVQHKMSFEKWFKEFKKKEMKIIKEMGIVSLGV